MNKEKLQKAKEIFLEIADASLETKENHLQSLEKEDPELKELVKGFLSGDRKEFHLSNPFSTGMVSPPEQIGPYKIIREIGKGGMGCVFEAQRTGVDYRQTVAVKLISPQENQEELVNRFKKERLILSQLNHPNIAKFIDGGTSEHGPFIVMEYIEGTPIIDFCNNGKLPLTQRIDLLTQVCDALEYAHRNLIVHRDIKPGNILVTSDGIIKLLDFGIAKILDKDHVHKETFMKSRTGSSPLTPVYCSPEQYLNQPITTSTDVYGLGLLCYELFTSQMAFDFKDLSLSQIDECIVKKLPITPSKRLLSYDKPAMDHTSAQFSSGIGKLASQLTGDLDTIIMMALRKEPERRYESIEAFHADLKRYTNGFAVLAHPDSWAYRSKKFIKRHWFGLSAATAITILFLALVTFSLISAQTFKQQALTIAQERDRAEEVSNFLLNLFEWSDPNSEYGMKITAYELLNVGAVQVNTEFTDNPRLQAHLLVLLGRLYATLGDDDKNLEFCRKSEKIIETHHIDTPKILADLHLSFAESYANKGEFRLAGQHHRLSVPFLKSENKLDKGYYFLGLAMQQEMKFNESIEILDKALAITEKTGKKYAGFQAKILNVNGLSHLSMGEFSKAEELYHRGIEIAKELYGDQHPLVGVLLNNLALTKHYHGKIEEAIPFYEESLKVNQAVFGEHHPSEAVTQSNLGVAYTNMGRNEDALRVHQRAMKTFIKLFGEQNSKTLTCMVNIGRVYNSLNEWKQGEDTYQKALNIARSFLEENHPTIGNILVNFSDNYVGQKKYDQALDYAVQAYEIHKHNKLLLHIAPGAHTIGSIYNLLGKPEKAIPYLIECISFYEEDESKINQAAPSNLLLGKTYKKLKRYQEAERTFSRAFQQYQAKYGTDSPQVKSAQTELDNLKHMTRTDAY